MMKFFRASYESAHFDFEAYAATSAEAVKLLKAAAKHHSREYSVVMADWFYDEDIVVEEFRLGSAYRDGEKVK